MDPNQPAPVLGSQSSKAKIPLTQLFSLTKDQAEQYALKLEQEGGEENLEMAKAVRALDPSFFDLTKGEQKLKELGEYLKEKKFEEAKIAELIEVVAAAAMEKTTEDIYGLMDENVKAHWDEFVSHDPNIFQIITMLDHICTELGDKDFDTLYDSNLEIAAASIKESLDKDSNQTGLDQRLSTIPKEYLEEVERLFDAGEYERAIVLIYQYSNNAQSTITKEE